MFKVIIIFFFSFIFAFCALQYFFGSAKHFTNRIERSSKNFRGEYQVVKNDNNYFLFFQFIIKMGNFFEKLFEGKLLQNSRFSLFKAGFRKPHHFPIYVFFRLVLSMVTLAIGLIFFGLNIEVYSGGLTDLVIFALLGAFFFVGSELLLDKMAVARRRRIDLSLPDCLDLLVVCTEAGLGLDASVKRVSRELAVDHFDLAEELQQTVLELNFLPERRQALENLVERCQSDAIARLVQTLIQSEKFGTPLSQALRVISDELRTERLTRAEEKAAKLPAVLTVPMIVFILPTLFIVLAGPAFIEVMDSMN